MNIFKSLSYEFQQWKNDLCLFVISRNFKGPSFRHCTLYSIESTFMLNRLTRLELIRNNELATLASERRISSNFGNIRTSDSSVGQSPAELDFLLFFTRFKFSKKMMHLTSHKNQEEKRMKWEDVYHNMEFEYYNGTRSGIFLYSYRQMPLRNVAKNPFWFIYITLEFFHVYFTCPAFLDIFGPLFWSSYS